MQMANVVLCAFIHDGLPSFYNRQENCQLSPFPVPTSDIFKQDCSSDLQDWTNFLVWVGYPWCLEFKRKFLLILSINLLMCFLFQYVFNESV